MPGSFLQTKIPDVLKTDDLIDKDLLKAYIKGKMQEEFKGFMKECFDEWLGDKRAKEIREERAEAKRQLKWQEENRRWQEEYKARREEEEHNPTINTLEASRILGVSRMTVTKLARERKIRGMYERNLGWFFKENYIKAVKRLIPIKPRKRKRRELEGEGYLTGEELKEAKIIPLTSYTLIKFARRGLIKHKVIKRGTRRDFYFDVEHIKELLANSPAWLKKSLKWREACRGYFK